MFAIGQRVQHNGTHREGTVIEINSREVVVDYDIVEGEITNSPWGPSHVTRNVGHHFHQFAQRFLTPVNPA